MSARHSFSHRPVFCFCIVLIGFVMLPAAAVTAAPSRNKQAKLEITRNAATGNITVSWNGKGVLKQSTTLGGHFKPVKSHGNSLTTAPEAEQMLYTIEAASSPIYSVNAVGYVNLQFPPGLSLIATPLLYYENTVEALLFNMPEGTQVYKYVPDFGYEVSSFDGAVWSNPDMDLSPGIGYFVLNPTSATLLNTYVGEVLQGVLVNNLPAGFSTEGALVPQQGSINDIHRIPGEPGDIIRLYVNNGQGGDYITSVFSGTDNAWLPDLTLGVAQGFVSEKQNAQDWIRVFSVIP